MLRRTNRTFLVPLLLAAFCGTLHSQTEKTITIRLLDGRTGLVVATTGLLVRANHRPAIHGDWVRQNENGTAEVKLPEDASVLSIHATYADSMETFVNCDSAKQIATSGDIWYAVTEILANGVVAPNGCAKSKAAEKLKIVAKPGEFVLFVRKLNWREQTME